MLIAGLFAALLVGALIDGQTSAIASADADKAQPLPWQGTQTEDGVLRGTFVQEKHLVEMDRPLVSSGTFVVARRRGLIWQVEQPLSTQLVITRQKMVARNDGRETTRITTAEQPGLAVVAAVLLAVFQGDMARLQQFFEIENCNKIGGRTAVTLRPATNAVSEFVQRVQIEGSKRVERIRIDPPGGDYSTIALKTEHSSAGADKSGLSAEEKAAFAH